MFSIDPSEGSITLESVVTDREPTILNISKQGDLSVCLLLRASLRDLIEVGLLLVGLDRPIKLLLLSLVVDVTGVEL